MLNSIQGGFTVSSRIKLSRNRQIGATQRGEAHTHVLSKRGVGVAAPVPSRPFREEQPTFVWLDVLTVFKDEAGMDKTRPRRSSRATIIVRIGCVVPSALFWRAVARGP